MSDLCEFGPPQEGYSWEDDDPFGCLFPGECCMLGIHLESQCHTAQHMEDMLKQQHEDDFCAWWEHCGLIGRVEKAIALEVWLAARCCHP
jgi:hypothetical protein